MNRTDDTPDTKFLGKLYEDDNTAGGSLDDYSSDDDDSQSDDDLDENAAVNYPTDILVLPQGWSGGDEDDDAPRMMLPRVYQTEMRLWASSPSPAASTLTDAHEDGIIAVLPTGTGKTYVAALTLLDYSMANPKKKTLFLVDKVPLCHQQAEALRMAFRSFRYDLKIVELFGGKSLAPLSEFDVLVAVAEKARQELESGRLRIGFFSLVVFDEVHHAVSVPGSSYLGSNHPYADLFTKHLHTSLRSTRPRVLGLTATPALGPKAVALAFSPSANSGVSSYKSYVEATCHKLQEMTRCQIRLPTPSEDFEKACRIPKTYILLKENGDEEAWLEYFSWWRKSGHRATDVASTDATHRKLTIKGDESHLRSKQQKNLILKCRYLKFVASHLLQKSKDNRGGPNKLKAIVFVTTIDEARCIADLFQTLSSICVDPKSRARAQPSSLQHLHPKMIVGHSAMKSWHNTQKPILQAFHSGKCQLLVCTSVLEEGIDVQDCNMVIRLDAGNNLGLRSFVQSRGRARSSCSGFILVCRSDEKEILADLTSAEKKMFQSVTAQMILYDKRHPTRSERIKEIQHEFYEKLDFLKGEEGAVGDLFNIGPIATEKVIGLHLACNDDVKLCVSVHSYMNPVSHDQMLRLDAALGGGVIEQCTHSVRNFDDAPLQHQSTLTCNIKKWKKKVSKSSEGRHNVFGMLMSFVTESRILYDERVPSATEVVSRYWFSIASAFSRGKTPAVARRKVDMMEIGRLLDPDSFGAFGGAPGSLFRFVGTKTYGSSTPIDEYDLVKSGPSIEIPFGVGHLLVRFSIDDAKESFVWPSHWQFVFVQANGRMRIDMKDVVAVIVSDAAEPLLIDDENCHSLLITVKRPPTFFIDVYQEEKDSFRSYRSPLPDGVRDFFRHCMTYRFVFRGTEQIKHLINITACLERYGLSVFFGSIRRQVYSKLGNGWSAQIERAFREGLMESLALKRFQSEYPWLQHHIFRLGRQCESFLKYSEEVKKVLSQKSTDDTIASSHYSRVRRYWACHFEIDELFQRIISHNCFFPDELADALNRGRVLFPVPEALTVEDSNGDGFDEDWMRSVVQRSACNATSLEISDHCEFVLAMDITPVGRTISCRPLAIRSNRVLRKFTHEPVLTGIGDAIITFLRVHFIDEDFSDLNDEDALSPLVSDVFENGVQVGPYNFQLLHWSNSQMRSKGLWLAAPVLFKPSKTSCGSTNVGFNWCRDDNGAFHGVFDWIGTLDVSTMGVVKYASRLALSFSTSIPTIQIPMSEVREIPDIKNDRFVFTDGSGQISSDCMRQVAERLGLEVVPSAIQIRFGGCKGVLVVCPMERGVSLQLRGSQVKFQSPLTTIEVLSVAMFNPCQLNQQIILLLTARGVSDEVFVTHMAKSIKSTARLLIDRRAAASYLKRIGFGTFTPKSTAGNKTGCQVDLVHDPFMRSLLVHKYRTDMSSLIHRTAIPIEQGAIVLGVPDDYSVLKKGEVFLQIRGALSRFDDKLDSKRIESRVIVTKNPCLHPGDIVRLTAVQRPEIQSKLGHLWNVIVFPTDTTTIDRPYPDMISGSDLDGDMYFVSWDETLLQWDDTKLIQSMDYDALAIVDSEKSSQPPKTLKEYYIRSCCGTNLGVVANAHRVWADKEGAEAEQCIKLAKLHSIAVDYPKTGIQAQMDMELMPTSYPQWMNKHDKEVYRKDTAIQKCCDLCPPVDPWEDRLSSGESNAEVNVECCLYPERDFGGNGLIQPDRRLLLDGHQKYYGDAKRLLRQYNTEILQVMRMHGLQHEAELFSGLIGFHRGYSRRERNHQSSMIESEMERIKTKYKKKFYNEFEGNNDMPSCNAAQRTDRIRQKASAWYCATYDDHYRRSKRKEKGSEKAHRFRLFSFPWVIGNELHRISCLPLDFEENNVMGKDQSQQSSFNEEQLDGLEYNGRYENLSASLYELWAEGNVVVRLKEIDACMLKWEAAVGMTDSLLFCGDLYAHHYLISADVQDSRPWISMMFRPGARPPPILELIKSFQTSVDENCRAVGDVLELPGLRSRILAVEGDSPSHGSNLDFHEFFHVHVVCGSFLKRTRFRFHSKSAVLATYHALMLWTQTADIFQNETTFIQLLFLAFISDDRKNSLHSVEDTDDVSYRPSSTAASGKLGQRLFSTLASYPLTSPLSATFYDTSKSTHNASTLSRSQVISALTQIGLDSTFALNPFGVRFRFSSANQENESAGELLLEFMQFLVDYTTRTSDDDEDHFSCVNEFVKSNNISTTCLTQAIDNSTSFGKILSSSSRALHQLLSENTVRGLISKESSAMPLVFRRYQLYNIPDEEAGCVAQKFTSTIQKNGAVTVEKHFNRMGTKLIINVKTVKRLIKMVDLLFSRLKRDYRIHAGKGRFNTLDIIQNRGVQGLAIMRSKDDILQAINDYSVVVIKAATGSGKSTAVPKIILEDCQAHGKLTRILCFQPRRIAAVSLARRVAESFRCNIGDVVGYQIGGDANTGLHTQIVYCTNAIGMLHTLNAVLPFTHVLIDEVHNRSIYDDIGMAAVKHYHLVNNDNLRLVLMSASADVSDLTNFFRDEIGSRCHVKDLKNMSPYPIKETYLCEIEYFRRFPENSAIKRFVASAFCDGQFLASPVIPFPLDKLGAFIVDLHREKVHVGNCSSSILVFLPGRADILELSIILDDLMEFDDEYHVERLLGSVPIEQQQQIVNYCTEKEAQVSDNSSRQIAKRDRSIILATDVVESSITIPECDIVIDTLTHKRKRRESQHSQEKLLSLEFISKDEALQRRGRTGRTRPGEVYRLVPRAVFDSLEGHPKPEILSANIADVLLILQELLPSLTPRWNAPASLVRDFSDPRRFLQKMVPTPPPTNAVEEAYMQLEELGAFLPGADGTDVDRRGLTPLGKILKGLYFDPRSVLIVLNGIRYGVLDEAVIIAAIAQRGSPFLDNSYFAPNVKAAQMKMKTICGKRKSDVISQMYAFMVWRLENNLRWKKALTGARNKKRKKKRRRARQNLTISNQIDCSQEDINAEAQWCWDHFLSNTNLREIEEVCYQIYDALAAVKCFAPSKNFLTRQVEISKRNRVARQTEPVIQDDERKEEAWMKDYDRLLKMKDLYACYDTQSDLSNELSVDDRDDLLLWVIASSFPQNILTVQGEVDNRVVTYISRNESSSRKKRQNYRNAEENLLWFLKWTLNLDVFSCRTFSVKNATRHSVTFQNADAAIVAAQLRPGNSQYPYRSNDRPLEIKDRRSCYRAVKVMVLSQENVCDLAGTHDVTTNNVLLNECKNGTKMYICFDLSVLPSGVGKAVIASSYPSFPRCSFKGVCEDMSSVLADLDFNERAWVSEIRNNLDAEFLDTFGSCRSNSNAFSLNAVEIVQARRNAALSLMKSFRTKGLREKIRAEEDAKVLRLTSSSMDVHVGTYAGRVIGKKGTTVKEIQQKWNITTRYNDQTKTFTLNGPNDGVQGAAAEIQRLCGNSAVFDQDILRLLKEFR